MIPPTTSKPPSPSPTKGAGEEAWLSHAMRVARVDLLDVLEAHAGQPRFYYAADGIAVAGVGIARRVRAQGPDRFQAIRDATRRIQQALGVQRDAGLPEHAAPLWVGRFDFEADADGQPTADFLLARKQLVQDAAHTYGADVRPQLGPPDPPLRTRAAPPRPVLPTTLAWEHDVDPATWTTRVRTVLHAIQQGTIEKLVLARSLRAPLPQPLDPVRVVRRLREAAPGAHVFLFEPTPGDAWLGASPEILARRTTQRVETAAIAGSRPRGRTPEEDLRLEQSLRASSKEAWEHELVCRHMRATLAEDGRVWRTTEDRGVLKLPNVQHLQTRFEADALSEEHVLDLAGRLHPTPAVSGAPRDAALRLLRTVEPGRRGAYAGLVGVFNDRGEGELAVAIRSAHLTPAHAQVYAGCGIVHGSDPTEEWEESRAKFQLVRQAIDAEAAQR
jgi:menaquinone-specific isochorismate synthase